MLKETEDQETVTAERPAVYPYTMDRLDDAISFIPFDEFEDVWKFVKGAEDAGEGALGPGARSSSGSIDQQKQLILNPKTGRKRQQQLLLPPNPSLAQVLAISLESVSFFFAPSPVIPSLLLELHCILMNVLNLDYLEEGSFFFPFRATDRQSECSILPQSLSV